MKDRRVEATDLTRAAEVAGYIKCQILTGVFKSGQRLPTAVQIAAQFGIDPNTARASYGRLKDEGLIESTRGKGTFVSVEIGPGEATKLRELIGDINEAAKQIGLSPEELSTIIWVHNRFRLGGQKVWYVDDWHPYMDTFGEQLGKATGLPIYTCTSKELPELLSAGTGPKDGDVVVVTRFNLEKAKQSIPDDDVRFFAISPRMAPATIEQLRKLPGSVRLGVVCIEEQFATISGKVIEKSGIELEQQYANTTDISALPGLFDNVDAMTISTIALSRLEAAWEIC